jgi:protein-S-isoprenylcysteine O-methyltransferase Ste14
MLNINSLNFGDWIILSLFLITIIGLMITELILRKKKISFAGKPPIAKFMFSIGKICIWGTWIALILQSLQINLRIIPITPSFNFIAIILIILSFMIFFASFFYLGDSLRIGLPNEKTELKISGIYKLSRNPIYVAFYLLAIASVIYALNPIVLIFH